jgi:hypothetical protein
MKSLHLVPLCLLALVVPATSQTTPPPSVPTEMTLVLITTNSSLIMATFSGQNAITNCLQARDYPQVAQTSFINGGGSAPYALLACISSKY